MAMLQSDALTAEVMQLRTQGLSDSIIMQELTQRGYNQMQVQQSIRQADSADQSATTAFAAPDAAMAAPAAPAPNDNIYDRIEEIAESMIDEKWDELIAEVHKIVDWKQKVEEQQTKLQLELDKLKENFQLLHQGVLGRLEEYDSRMRDVGTELKAVGKVFKDVIPEFVENVKELKSITEKSRSK